MSGATLNTPSPAASRDAHQRLRRARPRHVGDRLPAGVATSFSAVGHASNVAPSRNASAFVAARLVTCVATSPVSGSYSARRATVRSVPLISSFSVSEYAAPKSSSARSTAIVASGLFSSGSRRTPASRAGTARARCRAATGSRDCPTCGDAGGREEVRDAVLVDVVADREVVLRADDVEQPEHVVVVDQRLHVDDRRLRVVGVVLGDQLDLVLLAGDLDAALLGVRGSRSTPPRPSGSTTNGGVRARLRQARPELDRVAGDRDAARVGERSSRCRSRTTRRCRLRPSVVAAAAPGVVVVIAPRSPQARQHERQRPRASVDQLRTRVPSSESIMMVPFVRTPAAWAVGVSSTGDGAGSQRRTPPTMPSGRTYIKHDQRDAEDRRREQLRAVRSENRSLRLLLSIVPQEHDDEPADQRTDDGRGAADHDRDEELDRELERLDLARRSAMTGTSTDSDPAIPAYSALSANAETFDPSQVDADGLRRRLVVAHRDQRPAEAAARDEDHTDEEDRRRRRA